MTHSPAPWLEKEYNGDKHAYSPLDDKFVCKFHVVTGHDAGNKQLILSAPDLLQNAIDMHHVADILMAMLLQHMPGFMPSESAIWPFIVKSKEVIERAGGTV